MTWNCFRRPSRNKLSPGINPGMLRKNLKDIEDLILNRRFTPFPLRPKTLQLDLNNDPHIHQPPIPEEYPPRDDYENNRILIHPDLVNLWKQIEY